MSPSTAMPPAAAPPLTCIQIDLTSLQLAVPIDRVEKVVRPSDVVGANITGTIIAGQEQPQSDAAAPGSSAVPLGIVYYGDTTVTLLNLQQRLLQTATPTRYFLVLRASHGELIAVPIPNAPNLVEFPAKSIKALPKTYRQANFLGIASHVARIAEGETIFILDVDYLVTRWCVPQ